MADSLFGFSDPQSMMLLGALQGLSQYAGASRLPQTMGQAFGGAAEGMLKGIGAGQEYQLGEQKINSAALQNLAALQEARGQAALTGAAMPTMEDIRKGYPGVDWSKVPGVGQPPAAGPQLPGQPAASPGSAPQLPTTLAAVPSTKGAFDPTGTKYTPPAAGVGGAVGNYITKYAGQYNLDNNFMLTLGYGESRFDPKAVGPNTSGEDDRPQGVLQVKPSTAKDLGIDPTNPEANIEGGSRYFASLLAKNNGDYIKATQDYGTIPRDLSKMDANQAMVYHAALAANTNSNVVSDAGPPQIDTLPQVDPRAALRQLMSMQLQMGLFHAKVPAAVNDYIMAQTVSDPKLRSLMMAQLYKNAGYQMSGGFRAGEMGWERDPTTGQIHPTIRNPVLPQGAYPEFTPEGTPIIKTAPGASQAISEAGAAAEFGKESGGYPFVEPKARIHAGFEPPVTGYDEYGNPVTVPRTGINEFFSRQTQRTPPQPAPVQPSMVGGMATGVPGAGSPSLAAPQVGGLATGLPGAVGAPAAPPATQTPEAAPASFTVNTPRGQKPITQVSIDDMFPGGAGIPVPRGPAGPPTKLQEEVQKDDADRLAGYNKEQASNQQINADLLRLRGVLNRGFTTGSAARLGSEMANLAHSLGADWAYPKGWAPANAAEFDKASTDLVFAALKKLPGQPRVTEITGLQKANPALAIPRETNYQMMNDILAASKWQDERARLATEFTVQHKGVPLSVFDTAYNRMASLPDVANEYMNILRQNGAVFPEDVKAGGGPVSGAGSIPAPRERTKVIGGTTYHLTPEGWRPELK